MNSGKRYATCCTWALTSRNQRPNRVACELLNLITVAELIIVSAMARDESRGAQYRSDYPYKNDAKFKKHSVISTACHVDFVEFGSIPKQPIETPQGSALSQA